MKTFSKILLALFGLALVPLFLMIAAVRRLVSGPDLQAGEAVFVYSQVTWDEVWQRPQQYAWLTSKTISTVYCCPVQMHNLVFLGKKWNPIRRFSGKDRNLLVLSPLVFSGHFKNRWIHDINCWITAAHVKLSLPRAIRLRILANTPFAWKVIENLDFSRSAPDPIHVRRLIFDVIDDFTLFEWSPDFGREFDEKLTARADSVIAGTNELASARPNVPFIPCGVDFELFNTPQPCPSEIVGLPRPIIGYFGTISERINLHLVDRLAQEFPEGSIVMVGPVHFPADALPRRQNIHFLGLRRHGELPAFAQAYDVGLIPFIISEATTRLNPVKTLEYLAAGLPVVATALPDLVNLFADVVSIAENDDDFIIKVKQSIEAPDPERIRAGIDRARAASWQTMVDDINAVLFADDLPATGCDSAVSSRIDNSLAQPTGAAR